MYVCVCSGITEQQIEQAIEHGATSLQALEQELGVAANCGCCEEYALELIAEKSGQPELDPH